jgi:xylan 1,4-beta-xylosidase
VIPSRPVIPGFHPDPSVCRVGDDFYLVTSSFEYSPAVPIFHSRDLARWRQIGHVLESPEQLEGVGVRPSGGVYAPTLRHHQGRFWMITTVVTGPPGQVLVTATDPTGPWSPPVRISEARGIDPDLAWDEDGQCWLTWSGQSADGEPGILQARLDPDSGALRSPAQVIWRGTGGQYPEAPHLYQHEGFWYLVIAEGGTERGHAATVARSTRPDGPFTPSPSNPLLTARGTDSPTQNTGHADLVRRNDGSWAVVFLGVRSRGFTPWWHVLGRETFAAELDWVDGWPVLGQPIEPPVGASQVERLGPTLPLTWVSPDGLPAELMSRTDEGWRLRGAPDGEVFVGRRQQHRRARVEADLQASASTVGLEVRIDPRHRFGARVTAGRAVAFAVVGGVEIPLGRLDISSDRVLLEVRAEAVESGLGSIEEGPDTLVAVAVVAGVRTELGRLDGRYLSTEVAGGFTGRMMGLVTSRDGGLAHAFIYAGEE